MLDMIGHLLVALWLLHPPAMTCGALALLCGIGAALVYPRRGPAPAWSVSTDDPARPPGRDDPPPVPDYFHRRDDHATTDHRSAA